MDKDRTLICEAADRTAANAMGASFNAGPNTFSVALSTTQGVTNPALATHWAGSGYVPADMADAMEVSLDPKVWVRPNDQGSDFAANIAAMDPPLYRIYEEL